MFRALYTAATGMQAQQTNLDTIANNLANSSTTGFRSSRMQFQDLIYQNFVMPGAAASQQTTVAAGLQVGLGTRPAASEVLQLQGDLTATGNPLDLDRIVEFRRSVIQGIRWDNRAPISLSSESANRTLEDK
ncbi:MAG: flagellar hook-basal body complex protein [Terriglobales bacterium]